MKPGYFLLLLLFVAGACQSEDHSDWKSKDLLPYGIPLTVMAPDSVVVNAGDMVGSMQDVTLQGGEAYNLQIFADDANTNDISQVKADQIALVKEQRFFSRIVEEEENGFIYEYLIEQDNPTYGFRYIILQGDREFIFQPGLSSMYTLEEAQALYDAVKPR